MSHLVETMAWAGHTPWHGLGERVSNDLTVEQMQKASKTDWEVLRDRLVNERTGEYSGWDALVRDRDGRQLTMAPPDWHITQNAQAFAFFREFVEEGNMEMHTAGSLKDGQIVWVLAKVKESFTILGRDKVESYLLFTLPHEYGRSIDIRFTPIRVVCWNTLSLSLRTGDVSERVKLSHRKAFDGEFVKKTLGLSHQKMEKYEEVANLLSSKRYTDETVKQYMQSVFPKVATAKDDGRQSKPATVALGNLEKQPGSELGAGTWWQAFNAVTFSVDHVNGRTPETRLANAWYGQGREIKNRALEKALEFAKAA